MPLHHTSPRETCSVFASVNDSEELLSTGVRMEMLATYLRNNFLGGDSSSRPLDPAVLDGIDFDIEGGTSQHSDELARCLSRYSKKGKKVHLTTAPQSPFPNAWLGNAPKNSRLQAFQQLLFFQGCLLLLRQPRVGSFQQLISFGRFFPAIKGSAKYVGVMLWSKYYDDQGGYSSSIKSHI
ncbi:hypothetical protein SLEP1_g2403 [Rubroshorea leprosula]|uniref:GH18 domain-containing protein n=1 Tax=Rubroshorea leprosula TaxID=152421 RepID=A0AAV5HQC7_9ROSI|nr:hypothetical protein SLEP1_g2403 [Rubroshorea leprosula]